MYKLINKKHHGVGTRSLVVRETRQMFHPKMFHAKNSSDRTSLIVCRGRPWRYSVIPSTPDFPTEYQIRRHSNPAGLPTFAAIWGPDFRASIIGLTCPHVFKQIKNI